MADRSSGPRLESLTELGDVEWDDAVAGAGVPFRFSHRAAAGRALEAAVDSYEFTPLRADYSDSTSLLFPLVRMHRRLEAMSVALGMPLGFEGTPIPLHGTATAAHVEAMFKALDSCGALEIYGGAGGSPPELGELTRSETHTLDLRPGFEALWTGSFTPTNRNKCRKAQRAGVVVSCDSSANGLAAFAALHSRNAQNWESGGGTPRSALFAAVLATGHCELWLARVDGELAAGALLLFGSDDVLYWAAAMDRDHRNAAPGNAALAAAIEAACQRGVAYLDFGASAGMPGVETFKRSFGAQTVSYMSISLQSRRYRQLEWARQLVGAAHPRR